jgi:hypothetical protein
MTPTGHIASDADPALLSLLDLLPLSLDLFSLSILINKHEMSLRQSKRNIAKKTCVESPCKNNSPKKVLSSPKKLANQMEDSNEPNERG